MFQVFRAYDNKKIVFILFIIIYLSIIVYPAYSTFLLKDRLINDDIGSYLLTSKALFHEDARINNFIYSFPLFPFFLTCITIFFPGLLEAYQVTFYIGVLLLIMIIFAFYRMLSQLKISGISILTAVILMAFFRPELEELAWGGYAQFLSNLMGIIAVSNMIKFLYKDKSLSMIRHTKDYLLIGVPLYLSLFSQFYSAVFWILVVFLIIFSYCKKHENLTLLVTHIFKLIVFPSPLLVIPITYYIYFPQLLEENVTVRYYNFNLLIDVLLNIGEYLSSLIYQFTFTINTLTIMIFLVSFYLFFSFISSFMIKHFRKEHSDTDYVILKSMWFSLLIIALVTPAYYLDRFIYFLFFPLFTNVAIGIDVTLKSVSGRSSTQIKWNKIYSILLVLFILVSGYYVFLSISTYPDYLRHYSFPSKNLSYIDHIPLSILYNSSYGIVSHGLHPFVTAYSSGLYVYPDMQPVWFTRTSQVTSSILGRLLLSGDIYINTSNYYVSLDSQRGTYSIYIRKDPYFVKVYESLPVLIYFKAGDQENFIVSSSMSLSVKETTKNNIKLIYSAENIQLKITIIPSPNSLSTDLEIATYRGIIINRVIIPSFDHEGSLEITKSMKNSTMFQSSYILSYKEPWIPVKIPFNTTFSTSSYNFTVYPSSKNQVIIIRTSAYKLSYRTSIYFAKNTGDRVIITDFNSLIKELNIHYLLVIGNSRLYQLLNNRPFNLELVYEKDEIWLYRVGS